MPNTILTTLALATTSLLFVASVSSEGVPVTTGVIPSKIIDVEVVNETPSFIVSPISFENIELAGEAVPINGFGVMENLDRELIVNTYRHSSTILYLKRASRWFPLIERILAEEGIPDDFKYLAVIESGLSQAVSPAGARGFWQFMSKTAPEYGLEVSHTVDERYDVEKSTRAACNYLKESYEKFGSWSLAAASYNMGRAGVSKHLKAQGVDNYWDLHLNSETGRYVYRLLAVKEVLSSPELFGFTLSPSELYSPHDVRLVDVSEDISNLSDFALQNGSNLRELKALNPWLRKGYLNVKQGKTYRIYFPNTVTE
ncbi:MAG TPA: lytic transglycosylase domain-containing protein [Flavobacteriales bacterium]|nr:lytic transglycosylase domain-containing protein [Flavobacteriales bacterium]HIO15449.1 lytic transglycosylase domain-containing protein [Flavobacteriales bacterium]